MLFCLIVAPHSSVVNRQHTPKLKGKTQTTHTVPTNYRKNNYKKINYPDAHTPAALPPRLTHSDWVKQVPSREGAVPLVNITSISHIIIATLKNSTSVQLPAQA